MNVSNEEEQFKQASIDQDSINESAAGNQLIQLHQSNNRIGGVFNVNGGGPTDPTTNAEDEQLQDKILNDEEHQQVLEKRKLCKCVLQEKRQPFHFDFNLLTGFGIGLV